jgi:hypothetical protein
MSSSPFAVWTGPASHHVQLHIDREYADAVRERTWHSTQQSEDLADGSLRLYRGQQQERLFAKAVFRSHRHSIPHALGTGVIGTGDRVRTQRALSSARVAPSVSGWIELHVLPERVNGIAVDRENEVKGCTVARNVDENQG